MSSDTKQFMRELKQRIGQWCQDTILGSMLSGKQHTNFKQQVRQYMELTMVGARARAKSQGLEVEAELQELEAWVDAYMQ